LCGKGCGAAFQGAKWARTWSSAKGVLSLKNPWKRKTIGRRQNKTSEGKSSGLPNHRAAAAAPAAKTAKTRKRINTGDKSQPPDKSVGRLPEDMRIQDIS
jgi:hypothetical protein